MNLKRFREIQEQITVSILLLTHPTTVKRISAVGAGYANIIRAAIGPDELARAAQDAYVRGQIEADEFERRLEQIAREFPDA